MPKSRWPIQNELNCSFVDVLSRINLFGYFCLIDLLLILWFLDLYLTVCVCVFLLLSLCFLFVCSFFKLICLPF